jgi:hypothetical protein
MSLEFLAALFVGDKLLKSTGLLWRGAEWNGFLWNRRFNRDWPSRGIFAREGGMEYQRGFSESEYAGKRKRTSREKFLAQMEGAAPQSLQKASAIRS